MIYIFAKEGLIRIEDTETAEKGTAVDVTDGQKLYMTFMLVMKMEVI
jgi:hypothetical protein